MQEKALWREHASRLGTALLVAGGLALAGCTSGGEAEPSPAVTAPQLPRVEDDAGTDPYLDTFDTLDTSNITLELSTESPTIYSKPANVDPKTRKETLDFPVTPSAPLLEITLGAGRSLQYKDSIPGVSIEDQQLLKAVQANSVPLLGVMESNRVHSVRFRILEPDQHPATPELEPKGKVLFLPHDSTDGGRGNIYYFLPAKDAVDTEGLDVMIGHETTHAVLDHAVQPLTPEQRQNFDTACRAIRSNALADMEVLGWEITDTLVALREASHPKLYSAYDAVISALRNGTYDQLPFDPASSGVPACRVQYPWQAIKTIAERQGVAPLLDKQLFDNELGEKILTIQDGWSRLLGSDTVYHYLREATYLPGSASDERNGHPQDGDEELAGSVTNLMLKKPEALGENVKALSPDLQRAVVLVLDTTTGMLQTKYPDNPALLAHIQAQRELFDAALR